MADPNELASPFKTDKIAAADAAVNKQAAANTGFFPAFEEKAKSIDVWKGIVTADAAKKKEALASEVVKKSDEFATAAAPLLQRKEAIANRQVELQEMNPLKRLFLGAVKRDFNSEELGNLDKAVDGQIQSLAQRYTSNMGITDNKIRGINEDYEARMGTLNQQERNNNVDFQLGTQHLGVLGQESDALMTELRNVATIQQARAQATIKKLGTMTQQEVMDAELKSKQLGGKVTIDGIELSTAELTHAKNDWQKEVTNLAAAKVALRAGEIGLHNQLQEQALGGMSADKLGAIAAAGGVYNGQQFDLSRVREHLNSRMALNEDLANKQSMELETPMMMERIRRTTGLQDQLNERAQGLFGTLPPEYHVASDELKNRMALYTKGYVEAAKTGNTAAYIAKNDAVFRQIQQDQIKVARETAVKWGGGNKILEEFAFGHLTNTPVSPRASAEGLLALAENGLPAGTHMPQEWRDVFSAVEKINGKKPGGAAGQSYGFGSSKEAKAQDHEAKVQAVLSTIKNVYGNTTLNTVQKALPDWAREVKQSDGSPFEISRIPRGTIAAAQYNGEQAGYAWVAKTLGLKGTKDMTPVEQAAKLVNGGANGDVANDIRKKNPQFDFQAMNKNFNSMENLAILSFLKTSPDVPKGVDGAKAYTEFFNSPELQSKASEVVGIKANGNIVGYGANGIGPNAFDSAVRTHGKGLMDSLQVVQADFNKQERKSAFGVRENPVRFSNSVLAHIPDIHDDERKMLQAEIAKKFTIYPDPSESGARTVVQDADIKNWLTSVQFKNPALEAVRKKAVVGWNDATVNAEKSLRALTGDDPVTATSVRESQLYKELK